tara:strand:- start:819 stop:1319 length:501 start_codon:yes stop_codon:yes gene_type:complete
MPNWTSNEVRFKSRINSKKQLSKLKKRLRGVEELQEYISPTETKKSKEVNVFDFNKIIKMPKGIKNTTSPTQDDDKAQAKRRLKKYGAENWYDWACNNWGTKWNSCHTEIIEDERDGLTYTFDTAWDCPREIIDKLQEILDEELPFISIESWGCVHEDGQEFEQII